MKKISFNCLNIVLGLFVSLSVLANTPTLFNVSAASVFSSSEDSLAKKTNISFIDEKLPVKKIKWVEDDGGFDCIKYELTHSQSKYKVGEKVELKVQLEFIDQLPVIWREVNCTNISIKLVFPENFVVTGGSYYDYMPLVFSNTEKYKTLTVEGYFSNNNYNNACFILLKGPETSNSETIFIKKKTKCVSVNNIDALSTINFIGIAEIAKTAKIQDNLNSSQKKEAIKEQFILANTNNPIRLYTINPDLCASNQQCDSSNICIGEKIIIYAEGCENGLIQWSTGANTEQIEVTPIENTIYYADCIVNQIIETSDSAKITLSINQAPIYPLSISGPDSVCAGQSFELIANGCPSQSTYLFTFRNGINLFQIEGDILNQTTDLLFEGTYNVSFKCVEDSICSSQDSPTKVVKILQPSYIDSLYVPLLNQKISTLSLQSSLGNKFCVGETTTLIAEGCNGTVRWSDNSTGDSLFVTFQNISQSIDYSCEYNNCERPGSLTIPAGVIKLNSPTLVFDYDGQTNVKAASKTSATNLTLKASQCERDYKWWDGQQTAGNQRVIDVSINTSTQIYWVKCADPIGACISDSSSVGLYVLTITSSKDSLCFGDTTSLSMTGCTNGIVRWYKNSEIAFFGGGSPYKLINENLSNETFSYYGKCISSYLNQTGNIHLSSSINSLYLKSLINPPIISSNSVLLNTGQLATLNTTGCIGQINWSNGMAGSSIQVSVSDSLILTAVCINGLCSSNTSNTLKIYNVNFYKPTLLIGSSSNSACNSVIPYVVSGCPNGSLFHWYVYDFQNTQLSAGSGIVNSNGFYSYSQNIKLKIKCSTASNVEYGLPVEAIINYNSSQNPMPTIKSNVGIDYKSPNTNISLNANILKPFCNYQRDSIYLNASGCINGIIGWYNKNGTLISNDSTIYIGNFSPTYFSSGLEIYSTCTRNGCTTTPNRIYVREFSINPTTIATDKQEACIGETIKLTTNIPGNTKIEWFDGTSYSNTNNNSLATKFVTLTQGYDYKSKIRSLVTGCLSEFTNQPSILVKTVPPKPILLSSSTQFCGSDPITIKSTNCNGTLLWQWSNTNGQTGSLTVDSIRTAHIYNTTYTAKCTNSCGTSTEWSDPLVINKYTIPAPEIFTSQLFVYPGTEAYLFASNCDGGTVKWSNGMIGDQIQVLVDSINTYSATCQLGNCISSISNELTVKSCTFYKPSIAIVSEVVNCTGGNKTVQIQAINTLNHSVEWKVEDENGNIIFKYGRPQSYYGNAIEYFNVPENSYFSARFDNCSLWSDKIYIQSNGLQRPSLEVLNHPSTVTGIDLYTNICSIGEDSLILKAAGGKNGEYVWLVPGFSDNQNQFAFSGNNNYLYMDGGNFGYYLPTTQGENDSLFNFHLWAQEYYNANDGSIFVFNYKDGCLSYPTQLNFSQRAKPSKPVIVSQAIADCPFSQNSLYIQNPERGYMWYDINGIRVSEGDSLHWSSQYLTTYPSVSTQYYAVGINSISGCVSEPSELWDVNIKVVPDSVKILASSLVSCGGSSVLLKLPSCEGTIVWRKVGQNSIIGYDSLLVSPSVTSSYTALCEVCGNYIESDTVTIQVALPAPPIISASNLLVCNSATGRVPITFTASGCTGGTVLWSDGTIGTSFEKLVNESLIYSAVCKIGTCTSNNSNLVQITVLDPPLPPILSASTLIKCSDDNTPIIITAEACNGVLTWQGLSTNAEIIQVTPIMTTTYVATCTNDCGATSKSLTITVEQKPNTPVITANTLIVCKNEPVTLSVINCSGIVFWPFEWDEGTTIQYSPEETTTYSAICVSNTGTCNSDTAFITVNVIEPLDPIIAIPSQVLCEGKNINLSQSNCISNITWYNTSSLPISPIGTSSTLNLTLTGNPIKILLACNTNACVNKTYDTLSIVPIPKLAPLTIIASKDSVCLGESLTLSSSSCVGTLLWSTGASTPTISVSPLLTTVYTANCASICDTTTASLSVIVNQTGLGPNIGFFPNIICKGENARITVSGCAGTLVWLNGSAILTDAQGLFVKPLNTTTYKAFCNVNGCKSDTTAFQIVVNIPTSPILSTTSIAPVCPNSNITLKVENCNGTVNWSDGSSSIADGSGISTKSILITETTSYFASCETLGCSILDTSNVLDISISPLPIKPTITYSKNAICAGESIVATTNNCPGTVLWSNGGTGDTITISPIVTSTYFARCSTSCGTSLNSDSTVILVSTLSTPSLTLADSIICNGLTTTINATGCLGTINWTGSNIITTIANSIVVKPTANTVYTAICINGACQSLPVSKQVKVIPTQVKPVLSTANYQTSFCTDNSYTITAVGCSTGTLSWSNGSSNTNSITITPQNRGAGSIFKYSTVCTDICENLKSDTLTITVVNPVKPQILPATQEVCLGKNFTLNVSTACPGGFLQWKNTAFKDSTIIASGKLDEIGQYYYSVRCVIGNCISAYSDSVIVKVNPLLDASITTNSIVYVGDAINFTSTFKASNYSWTGPNGFTSTKRSDKINKANSTDGGVYTLTVSGTGVCSATASVNITVLPATTFAVRSNSPICESQTLTLSAEGGKNYAWSGPNGFTSTSASLSLSNASVNASGTYTVTVTTKKNTTTTASIAITINPKPKGFMANQSACSGNKLSLTAPLGSSYKWTGPNNFISARQNPELTNLGTPQQGAYKVVVNTLAGCSDSSSFNLVVNPSPTFTLTSNTPLDPGQVLNVSSTATGALQWSGPLGFAATTQNIQIPNITPEQAGYYKLKVTNAFNCTKSDSIFINVASGPINCEAYTLNAKNALNEVVTKLTRDQASGTYQPLTLLLVGEAIPSGVSFIWSKNGVTLGETQTLQVSEVGDFSLKIANTSATCYYNFNLSGDPCLSLSDPAALQCSAAFDFPAQADNELAFLKVGDKFIAADYTFEVTEITSNGPSGFSGLGVGTLRVINGVDIEILPIEFKDIALNSCYQYVGVTRIPTSEDEFVGIRTQYDPEWKNIIDVGKLYKNIKDLFKDLLSDVDESIAVFENESDEDILEYIINQKAECQAYADAVNKVEDYPEPAKVELIAKIDEICALYDEFFVCKTPGAQIIQNSNARFNSNASTQCNITSKDQAVKISEKRTAIASLNDYLYVYYDPNWKPFILNLPSDVALYFFYKDLNQIKGTIPGINIKFKTNRSGSNIDFKFNPTTGKYVDEAGNELNATLNNVFNYDIDQSKIKWGHILQIQDCSLGSYFYWIYHNKLSEWKATSDFNSTILNSRQSVNDLTCPSVINLTGAPLDLEGLEDLFSGKKPSGDRHNSNVKIYITKETTITPEIESSIRKAIATNSNVVWIHEVNGVYSYRSGFESQISAFDKFFEGHGVTFSLLTSSLNSVKGLSTALYEFFDMTSKGLEKLQVPEYAWNCNHKDYNEVYANFFKVITLPLQAIQTRLCGNLEQIIGAELSNFKCNNLGNYQFAILCGLWDGFVDIFKSASDLLKNVGGLASDNTWSNWSKMYDGMVNYERIEGDKVVSKGWMGALKDGVSDYFNPAEPCKLAHNVAMIVPPVAISFIATPTFAAGSATVSNTVKVISTIAKVVNKVDDFAGLPFAYAGKFVKKGVFKVFRTLEVDKVLYEIRDGIFKGKILKADGKIVNSQDLGLDLNVDNYSIVKEGCVGGFVNFSGGHSVSNLRTMAGCKLMLKDKNGNTVGEIVEEATDVSDLISAFVNKSLAQKLDEITSIWNANYPEIFEGRSFFEDIMGHYRYAKSSGWSHTGDISEFFKGVDFYKGTTQGANIYAETAVSMKTTITTNVDNWLASAPIQKNIQFLNQGKSVDGLLSNGKTMFITNAEIHIYMPKANITGTLRTTWMNKLTTTHPGIKFEIKALEDFVN